MPTEIYLAVLNGIVWGLAIALVAVGLLLTFGFLRLMNLAHGAFYALGAVIGFYAVLRLGSFGLAVLLVVASVGTVGLLVERSLLRRVRATPDSEVLITFGLTMIIEYGILVVFGAAPRRIAYPLEGTVNILGSSYPIYRLMVGGIAFALLLVCMLILENTSFGLQVRAANQDGSLAEALGVPVNFLTLVTFGVGAACAAFAGLMMAPLVAVEYRMGADIMAISFLVTILGGLTRVWRVTGIAVCTAVLENVGALWLDPRLTRGLVLLVLFIALLAMRGRGEDGRFI